jgi:hypothetical protein
MDPRLRRARPRDDHAAVRRLFTSLTSLSSALSPRLAAASLLVTAALSAGCVSPYVAATESFGKSTSAGVAAFTPIFDTASELCFRDAELEHLQHRLENGKQGWGTEPLLGEIRTRGKVKVLEPGSSKVVEELVADRCGRLEIADAVLGKALQALAAYGRALAGLAANMALDTKSIGELAASSAGLAAMLTQNPTSSRAQTETMLQVTGPLGELARVIAQSEVENDLKETIRRADPHVTVILGKARLYLKATRGEARNAQTRMEAILNTADESVRLALREPPRPPPPPPKPAPPPPVAAPAPGPRSGDGVLDPWARKGRAASPPVDAPPPAPSVDVEGAILAALEMQAHRSAVLRASVSPQDVFALYDLATRERRRAADVRKALDSFDAILDGLARAEGELLAAASGKTGEKEALARVFAAANGVLAQIEVLRALSARKD